MLDPSGHRCVWLGPPTGGSVLPNTLHSHPLSIFVPGGEDLRLKSPAAAISEHWSGSGPAREDFDRAGFEAPP